MKRIGIFTKTDMAGGSEFRAAELATTIARMPGCESAFFAEKLIPQKLRSVIGEEVEVYEEILRPGVIDALYSVESVLVINSDSREFTTHEYWTGGADTGRCSVDLARLRQMAFLFNYIVSPSCKLPSLRSVISDIRIITANQKFFAEISIQERYRAVRHYPRAVLESPINPSVAVPKTQSERIRLGMHSRPVADKWNREFPDLIHAVNDTHGDRIIWEFMGMPNELSSKIRDANVACRPEFSISVQEYLAGIDCFVFFGSWNREEAWARSVGEALMTGCAIVATGRGGNRDQVTHGNTGFLCRSLDEFAQACRVLIDDDETRVAIQTNAKRCAQNFTSRAVTERLFRFLQ